MAQIQYMTQMKAFTPCDQNYEWGSGADPGSLKGGGGGGQVVGSPGHPLPEKISMFFQANLPEFMSASNHQERYKCECAFFNF